MAESSMTTDDLRAAIALTDKEIDLIANDGHRNAAGGIYATSVYEFARAVIRAAAERAAGQPPAPASEPQAEPQPEAIPIAPVEVVRQALKELLESISECRMDQVTARFAKASVMARAVVDRYKDAT